MILFYFTLSVQLVAWRQLILSSICLTFVSFRPCLVVITVLVVRLFFKRLKTFFCFLTGRSLISQLNTSLTKSLCCCNMTKHKKMKTIQRKDLISSSSSIRLHFPLLTAQLQSWATEELLNWSATVQNTHSLCYLLCSFSSCKYPNNYTKGCAIRLLFVCCSGSCCFRLPSSIDLSLVCL